MSDQETTPEPPKRMTTAEAAKTAQEAAQNASAALRVAQGADDMVAAVSEQVTDLGRRVRDRETAHAELRDEIMQRLAGVGPTSDLSTLDLTMFVTRDMVDSRIHEGLQPLHDEVHQLRAKGTLTPESTGSLAGVLARLEDAERKVAAVSDGGIVTRVVQEVHPLLSDLRTRLGAVEATTKALSDPGSPVNAYGELPARIEALERELRSQGDPVSATLAEDHLSDQVQAQVERHLDGVKARFTQMARELDEVRVHLGAIDNRVLSVAPSGRLVRGTGASAKVLQLMRNITHIGKEKEANLGKGGRFQFRGIDDAMDAVGHAMRDVGLVLSTEVLDRETTLTPVTQQGFDNGQKWERTVVWATSVVTMRYTFTDPEDGSTHVFEMVGEGRDSSDKSTSKATAMACKYGLFQALMIPVTGLDDADDAPPQQMVDQRTANRTEQPATRPQPEGQPAQQQEPPTEQQRAHRAGEALAAVRNLHRLPRAEQYSRLVQIMNRVNQEGLLEFVVEGSTLNQHGLATMATLRQQSDQDKQQGTYDHRASTEPPMNDEGAGEYN